MKPFVALGLFAAAGCNQILGLEPTVPVDAEQPLDAPLPIARLTWLVADTDMDGKPLAAPLLTPMDPAPTVQVGPIDGDLVDTSYLPDGSFTIPATLTPGLPWRVVYQAPGAAPPVEVQWTTPTDRVPHLTEPFIGHLVRTPLPGPASAVTITPTGAGVSFASARVAFTGVWGESPTTSASGTTLTFNLNNVLPFTGPKGAPEPVRGDRVVVLNYGDVVSSSGATCRKATGGVQFDVEPTAGTEAKTPAWYPDGSAVTNVTSSSLERYTRAAFAINAVTGEEVAQSLWFGKASTLSAPLFVHRRTPSEVAMPAMITLFECDLPVPRYDVQLAPANITQAPFAQLPGLGVGRFTSARTVTGTSLRLVSGYVGAATSLTSTFALDTAATVPVPPYLLGTTDLGGADHVGLIAGTEPLTLTFAATATQGADGVDTSDYYEVVLHRVTPTSITPVRTFRVLERSVSIARSLLTAGTEYVFELRSFAGAPQARTADFTAYTVPQSQGVMFTRTFIAP